MGSLIVFSLKHISPCGIRVWFDLILEYMDLNEWVLNQVHRDLVQHSLSFLCAIEQSVWKNLISNLSNDSLTKTQYECFSAPLPFELNFILKWRIIPLSFVDMDNLNLNHSTDQNVVQRILSAAKQNITLQISLLQVDVKKAVP